jgi:hypothetical protein
VIYKHDDEVAKHREADFCLRDRIRARIEDAWKEARQYRIHLEQKIEQLQKELSKASIGKDTMGLFTRLQRRLAIRERMEIEAERDKLREQPEAKKMSQ